MRQIFLLPLQRKKKKNSIIMPAATTRQTLTITFDPSSLYAQTLVQTLKLSKVFKVEENPYDMRYVRMVGSAEKGESHRVSRDELWK